MLPRGEHPELAPPLDFSFCCISSIEELPRVQPRAGPSPPQSTHALRLNNNCLGGIRGLLPTLERLLVAPAQLAWLDLSFNRLTIIDPVLTTLHALRSLQLHGNSIARLGDVDKLRVLPRLRRLTLHGNPMEEQRGYRSYVLSLLPHLTSLDFSSVTRQDRNDADVTGPRQHGKNKRGTPRRESGHQDPTAE